MSIAAEHWHLVDPSGAPVINVARRGGGRRTVRQELSSVRPGAPVVLECGTWGARRRCARFARREGLRIRRSYIALPSLQRASFRVEDTPTARAWFAENLLTTPPGAGRFTPVADLAVRFLQFAARSSLLGALVPGRVVVATRVGPGGPP